MTDQTRPCTVPEDTAVTEAAFRFTGSETDPITSNEHGEVFCCFHLPAETYAVGSRDLVIADRENVDQARAAMSTAAGTFNAYNFGVEKGSLQITTKHVTIGKSRVVTGTSSTSTSSRSERTNSSSQESITGFTPDPPPVVFQPAWIPDIIEAMPAPPVQQPVPVRPPAPIRTPTPPTPTPPPPPPAPPVWEEQGSDDGDGGDGDDPLAQTFIVKSPATGGGTKDHTGLMITKMDLYFETKDPVLGITVQIRTCDNGFPAPEIMPGGNIHLRSSEVNTSADGTVATTVSFDYPVHLAVGQEYCFVLLPDANNPNYNVWVRKTGETDKTTGVALNKDEFEGVMFMSTNNRAWRPYKKKMLNLPSIELSIIEVEVALNIKMPIMNSSRLILLMVISTKVRKYLNITMQQMLLVMYHSLQLVRLLRELEQHLLLIWQLGKQSLLQTERLIVSETSQQLITQPV